MHKVGLKNKAYAIKLGEIAEVIKMTTLGITGCIKSGHPRVNGFLQAIVGGYTLFCYYIDLEDYFIDRYNENVDGVEFYVSSRKQTV